MARHARAARFLSSFVVFTALALTGCASYVVPGGAADMAMFADREVRTAYQRQPASPIPAHIAFVRVQSPGYVSHTCRGYGSGNYSVITVRDVEKDEDFARVAKLPDISGVAGLNRLLIGGDLKNDVELRRAAASINADMLVIYTFDTAFHVDDMLRPLSVVTLGLFPTKVATVTTTVSSLLLDVRTGYIYATGECTAQRKPLANAWTSSDAVDLSRQETEREAFTKLLTDFERAWPKVADERRRAMAQP